MRAMHVMILLSFIAGMFLSGCIVVPAGGWYGHEGGRRHPHHYSPYHRGHGQ
jgi:hypothetical protein